MGISIIFNCTPDRIGGLKDCDLFYNPWHCHEFRNEKRTGKENKP